MSELERMGGRRDGLVSSLRRSATLLGVGFVAGIVVGILFSVLIKTILIIAAVVIVVGALARGYMARRD